MRTIASIIAAAGLAVGFAAAPASAFTVEQLHTYERVADQVWPDSPCKGRAQVVVTNDLGTGDAMGEATVGGRATLDAEPGTDCTYKIRPTISDEYKLCVVVVHELGHLAGSGHTATGVMERDAMLHSGAADYAPCVAAMPVKLRVAHASRILAAKVAGHQRSDCTLASSTSRVRTYRCVDNDVSHARKVRVTLNCAGTAPASARLVAWNPQA